LIYHQLWSVLEGFDSDAAFAHLSGADREAILDILSETKPALPSYWRRASAGEGAVREF